MLRDMAARHGAAEVVREVGGAAAPATSLTLTDLAGRAADVARGLIALGIEPRDRVAVWAPNTPDWVVLAYGLWDAGAVVAPLSIRYKGVEAAEFLRKAGAKVLFVAAGEQGAGCLRMLADAAGGPDAGRPCRDLPVLERVISPGPVLAGPGALSWEEFIAGGAAVAAEAAEDRALAVGPADLAEIMATSGTTGTPKGVMLTHDNVVASIESFHRIVPPMEHRLVSLLPLSHLLEQAVGLYYALDVGADVLYVRSRNPRVIFEALRDQRVTSMVVVPQVLDLFWSAIEREVAKRGRTASFERLRGIARRLPVPVRRLLFRSIHQRLGGQFRLFLSSGAFLPPALQQGWEDLGVTVLQGYGATETGTGSCTTLHDHGPGTVGRVPEGIEMRLAPDGEIQFRGRTVFSGYWNAPELTTTAFTDDGWYRTGDLGHFDPEGRLVLSGRLKDMIVLPNGFNVYPEDIENALRIAGIRDSVVLETEPGRIEAVVLGSATGPPGAGAVSAAGPGDPAAVRERLDAAVKAANATLGPNQRIAGWRLWPDEDFPRTHTYKIKRTQIAAWIATDRRPTGA
jgi:long-chain acyl-CoA synthetase